MLDQRRRRWANIEKTLDEVLVFAGSGDWLIKQLINAVPVLAHRLQRWSSIDPTWIHTS